MKNKKKILLASLVVVLIIIGITIKNSLLLGLSLFIGLNSFVGILTKDLEAAGSQRKFLLAIFFSFILSTILIILTFEGEKYWLFLIFLVSGLFGLSVLLIDRFLILTIKKIKKMLGFWP